MPSARPLAASIPCVSGRPCAIVDIHEGRSFVATFAPVKTRRIPNTMFESVAVSRASNPTAAVVSPRPVQAQALMRMTSAIEG